MYRWCNLDTYSSQKGFTGFPFCMHNLYKTLIWKFSHFIEKSVPQKLRNWDGLFAYWNISDIFSAHFHCKYFKISLNCAWFCGPGLPFSRKYKQILRNEQSAEIRIGWFSNSHYNTRIKYFKISRTLGFWNSLFWCYNDQIFIHFVFKNIDCLDSPNYMMFPKHIH